MNNDDAKAFWELISAKIESKFKEQSDIHSSIYACLAIVTDVGTDGAVTVRLLSSPDDGSQDFVARNHSGSVLEVGDSVWLHYWGDYTNAYIAVRNMGDMATDITPTGIGALSYAESQTLTVEQKEQARLNIGAEESILVFTDISVSTSSWSTYTEASGEETLIKNAGFTYRKSLTLTGITTGMSAVVIPSEDKKACGTTIHEKLILFTDGAYIYAKAIPTSNFTLRKVLAITE